MWVCCVIENNRSQLRMEKENIRTNYFQYFANKPSFMRSQQHPSPPRRYDPPKLLPHIIEEYQYRITNHLLIKKIISPKRDKIIMNSLENVRRHRLTPNKHRLHSTVHNRHTHVPHSADKRVHRSHQRLKTTENSIKHEQSLSQTNPLPSRHNISIFSNHLQREPCEMVENEPKESSKMGGVLRSLHERRKANKSDTLLLPEVYGVGPTILCISQLHILTTPPLRNDALLQLELVERTSLSQHGEEEEKVVRTQPITFSDFPREDNPRSKVKFALRISRIGDFVPLRLWKYCGVECSELGTVDIPLSVYRLALSQGVSFMENENVQWQGKAGSEFGRTAVSGEVSCQLRRGNAVELQARVVLKYKIYAKRFGKPRESGQGRSIQD